MRVCAVDLETTGLEHDKDHISEIGWVIKTIGDPKPLVMKSRFCQLPDGAEISDEIHALTKITAEHCSHGTPLETNVKHLLADLERFKVDYMVGHNALNFDKPFLEAKIGTDTALSKLPWLDTQHDCVYPPDCRHNNLMYVAAYFGTLNPFPHAALFDAMTCLKVLEQFDVEAVAARSKIPWIVVRAVVDYDQREMAKARRYYWENLGAQKFPKSWVKKIKETDLEKETSEAPFAVARVAHA